ncbi:MAG: arabinofuranosyltransferase [Candidatus Magasanikbacteria bacterium]|nr:arabinofuranosyltransferase [Candidatus Magasanikbacteria bacterium]
MVGVISSASYFLWTNNLQLLFWGLQGDEITIAAMYNTFASVGLWSDFAYHNLPPFYPPAFFWFFGLIGGILNWNGIKIAKFAAFSFFLVFPIGSYYYQKYLLKDHLSNNKTLGLVFIFLTPLFIITILDKDLLIGKPYEVITAVATIFWYVSLHLKISRNKWNLKQGIIYGLIAGIIFMTYYLWLIFAAIAFLLMGIVEEKQDRIKYFLSLFKTMLITIFFSLPFILPLIISYFKNGMESWQTSFFVPNGLDLWMPIFQLNSINNIIMFFGFSVLIYYRKHIFIKQLLYLLITAFVWWGLAMTSLLVLKIPFQEFRGFYILSPSILAISAVYGAIRLWRHFNIDKNKNLSFLIIVIGILYFASQSVFGFFVDDPVVKMRRVESREANGAIVSLVNYLDKVPESNSKLTLLTVPQVLAFVPVNHLIYFNQNNNHPASIFSERYEYLQMLANSKSSKDLYENIKKSSYGDLERFIFYGDEENYYLYFHLDKMISGVEEEKIKINKNLFSYEYFEKVYEKNGYTVINILEL